MDIDIRAIRKIIKTALKEDIGNGDVTANSIIPADTTARGIITAKSQGIIAGLDIAMEVFRILDPNSVFVKLVPEGHAVYERQDIAKVEGLARALLSGERTALNFLQRLSGIATLTAKYVQAASGYKTKIIDTRKTTPGLRLLEKYAVRVGGGHNHRFGLYDAVLIKDNHISVAGGITQAVARARDFIPHTMKIEVEVETIEQVQEAMESRADIIMLDNMDLEGMAEAVKLINGKALVEASGGIKLENVALVAATGVDLISAGALTNSAMPLDINMSLTLI